jgi:hypothetical protein
MHTGSAPGPRLPLVSLTNPRREGCARAVRCVGVCLLMLYAHAVCRLLARRSTSPSNSAGKTLAELVREAVDAYLAQAPGDPEVVLEQTFGSIPDLQTPARSEWDRGYG